MKKFKVLLVYPNLMLVSLLPNNIAILAACLKREGYDVRLVDTTLYRTTDKTNDEMRVERMQVRKFSIEEAGLEIKERDVYDDFAETVKEFRPDLIAVSVVDDTVEMGINLVKRADCSGIPVIFGGVYATFNPEKLIKQDEIEIVCVGEGEESLLELCHCLKNGLRYDHIQNLWVKQKNGAIIKNPLRPPINLGALPFEDFSIFEKNRIFRPMQGKMLATIPINFDRGCPYQCAFCAAPSLSDLYKCDDLRYYRIKSTEQIYRDMKYQMENNSASFFYFNSETFLAMSVKKLKEFSEMYAEFRLPFWCQTRIETVTEEKVRILREMNCDRISIGLEHGNEEFRKKILRKTFTNEQVVEAFRILNKYNIKISVNNMIGFPDETRELVFDTIRLNRKLKADSINGFVFQPYSGTRLRAYCIEKGYLSKSEDITANPIGSPIGSSVLTMPQFTQDEIEGLLRTFVLYVKMPEAYFPKIKVAEQLNIEGERALDELREVFFREYFS